MFPAPQWPPFGSSPHKVPVVQSGDWIRGGPEEMAIYRLLQNSPMGPEEISRLETAYEQTLRAIGLKDRNDPITEMIAKKIIEIAQTGVRDPAQISTLAIKEIGIS